MITLSIAIIILVVITSMLVYNAQDGVKIKKLNGLYNDIETLSSKVSTYYQKYGDIPGTVVYASTGNTEQNSEFIEKLSIAGDNGESVLNPNDSDTYYVLDLQSLDIVTLNYGRDYEKLSDAADVTALTDIYVINKASHTIYYPKGITVEGVTYYTDQSQYSEIDLKVIPIYTAEELSWVGDNQTHAIAEKDGVEYTFTMDGIYSLQNDIDLSSICYKVDGTVANDKSWTPIGTKDNPFEGTFLGNDYTIKNFYINNTNQEYQGLFGYIKSAVIQDTTLNGTIRATGDGSVGGICGYGKESSITKCVNYCNVSGGNAGGIMGLGRDNIQITSCFNYGKITSSGTFSVGRNNRMGCLRYGI
jgi:hypothetical protein